VKNMYSERVTAMKFPSLYAIAELAKGYRDVIFLNVGSPDIRTPEHIINATKRALDEGYTRYTNLEGIRELRDAIARKYNEKYGLDLNYKNVLITIGVTQGIFASIMSYLRPGEKVLVPDPWYPGYLRSTILAGGEVVTVRQIEEKNYNLDLDELNEKIDNKTKILILINPNNPTGAVYDYKTLKGIAEIVSDNKIILVSDEIYEEFTYVGKFHSVLEFPEILDKVVLINGFSKAYAMTGFRIGYAISTEESIKQLAKVTLATGLCPVSISQYAALAAIEGPREPIREIIKIFDRRRREIVAGLSKIRGINFVIPKGAFYIFPNISFYGIESIDLVKYLVKEARVVAAPGYPFFGPSGKGHIRIAYTVDIEQIKEACRRIKEALEKLIECENQSKNSKYKTESN